MYKILDDIYYVGVNDHQIDLFEGQYEVPLGMAYNSYIIDDELIAIFDTVEINFYDEWIKGVKEVLKDRKPNFLIVQHMEPDHSANIMRFLGEYPDTYVVGNEKTFKMIDQFFHKEIAHKLVVDDNSILSLGKHILHFIAAPMVHWPEVMVTFDETSKVLFSADAFGKFGANDVVDPEGWDCEARRYYFGIVGKYGMMVQNLLKKASKLDIKTICPLHGPVLQDDLTHYLSQYNTWSSYAYETDGVTIFYTSVYGHTKEAAYELKDLLDKYGAKKVAITDLARDDMFEAVEDAFRYSKVVFATTTYNMEVFPFMNTFLSHLVERNFQNKVVGIIENGSWAPNACKVIKEKLSKANNLEFVNPIVTIRSSMDENNHAQLDALAKALLATSVAQPMVELKKETKIIKRWRCKICGYIYEGESLPSEFTCPMCKHPSSDFEEIK